MLSIKFIAFYNNCGHSIMSNDRHKLVYTINSVICLLLINIIFLIVVVVYFFLLKENIIGRFGTQCHKN